MNDDVIVAAYVVINELMQGVGHRSHPLARVGDAEVLTVAVVAAAYFHNHHERALQVMLGLRYLSGRLSVSRFSRRLHQLAAWLRFTLETLGELFAAGAVFRLDSMPGPVCRRAAPAAAARCGAGSTAATAPPSGRRSSAGGSICSAPPPGCRWPSTCCPRACTT